MPLLPDDRSSLNRGNFAGSGVSRQVEALNGPASQWTLLAPGAVRAVPVQYRLRLTSKCVCLLVTQRIDRIDARSAGGGTVKSGQGHGYQHQRSGEEHNWIVDPNPE